MTAGDCSTKLDQPARSRVRSSPSRRTAACDHRREQRLLLVRGGHRPRGSERSWQRAHAERSCCITPPQTPSRRSLIGQQSRLLEPTLITSPPHRSSGPIRARHSHRGVKVTLKCGPAGLAPSPCWLLGVVPATQRVRSRFANHHNSIGFRLVDAPTDRRRTRGHASTSWTTSPGRTIPPEGRGVDGHCPVRARPAVRRGSSGLRAGEFKAPGGPEAATLPGTSVSPP